MLVILFSFVLLASTVWEKLIHPWLFAEKIEDKIEGAVEEKTMKDVDDKVKDILNKQ